MIFKRIDHVEIVTDQPDRTEKFYTEVLGFTVKARDRIERSGLGVPIDLVYLDLGGTVSLVLAKVRVLRRAVPPSKIERKASFSQTSGPKLDPLRL